MSRLTFAAAPDGLVVPVLIGLNSPDQASLIAAGQPPLPPILARGLIDTGCDATGVASDLLKRLGLQRVAYTTTQADGGQMTVDLYEVSLSITDPATAGVHE